MKIEINITKSHLYLILAIVILLIASFVIGQASTEDFGHIYQELNLRDAQGDGLITGDDIKDGVITGDDIKDGQITADDIEKIGGHVALNVLKAQNAGAASCNFLITHCGLTQTGQACGDIPGFYQIPGGFSFIGMGWDDKDYTSTNPCNSGGRMVLCCQQLS